ncbi:hypothetical protein M378DRAFT_1045113 [Amanita muscaria Koide BX008]|uniref:Uncharacterized protein n=1 Tax=Amanita muscaria (strain Koide BX008) TaxID=946122 RepID=A0A0C2SMX8_AMAMK|nr:hypothetical protein M378DRAFT_1045113 [Amanita muscaria Koide BX008]
MTNFVAIHTTTMTLASLMYELTKHQEYIQLLRQEIETVIAAEGWSKSSAREMWKLDGFIKESPASSLGFSRKALKDFSMASQFLLAA